MGKKSLSLVALLFAVVFLVTACGGGTTTGTGGNATNTAGAAAKTKTIVDGIFEEPNQLNPILGPAMTYQSMVEASMFSGLIKIKPDGTIVPDLATEVPTQQNGGISKDNLTYTFHLRKDAKWSDGQPFTAKDVVFTWKSIMNKDITPLTTQGFDQITSIDTPDDYTVIMHLKAVYAPFLTTWVGPLIIPEHVLGQLSGKDFMKADYNHKPTVTLGPFKFKEWVPADHITVVRDDNYFGSKAKVEQVVFKVIADQNAQLAALQNGEINVYFFAPITQLDQLKAIKDANVNLTKEPNWEHIVLNMKNPILADKRVRQALNYAIDKNVLIKDVWKGLGVAMGADQPPVSWAYDPNVPIYEYNPDKANQLLDAAGWKMGSDGYRHKDGKILELYHSTTAKNPWREQSQKIDQEMLKKVGVKMVIKNYDAATYFGTVLAKGTGKTGAEGGWDMAEFMDSNSYDPDVVTTMDFGSDQTPDKGGDNFGWYSNKQVDALLKQEQKLTDPALRKPIFAQIQAILHEDAPNIFLYSPMEIDVSRGITGYTPNPWGVDTWNIADWDLK